MSEAIDYEKEVKAKYPDIKANWTEEYGWLIIFKDIQYGAYDININKAWEVAYNVIRLNKNPLDGINPATTA